MMETTEQLLERAAMATNGTTKVMVGDPSAPLRTIDFRARYKRITMYDAI